ncbi:N-methyl-L-tryptophan oxidase [Actinomadura viridis]|uniref:Glycine/D-amino acid oxidase-like deaminating enzyme n=1 Tax=Actinomadura viridis TaxID=58110 RepID=A0A931GKN3_9ACTN|nr:FAD-dependent oxidoreductase [Actinomadura viridis]MBG6090542.1 glycine/D-amino acid oxidase-like deaminating enzyme [Actinomadura viridis]
MADQHRTFDLAVVGGGAVGLSCAWRAARAGLSVVLLEQDEFFGDRASSAGVERQWRFQYSDEEMTRLVLAAVPLWRELEEAAGRRLIHTTGSLWFGEVAESTNEGHISDAAKVLERLDLPFEWVTAAEIERRFGFRDLPGHYEGFYQPGGGVIDVKGTLFALYCQARAAGADLRERQRVTGLAVTGDGVRLSTGAGTLTAGRLVVAGGAYSGELLRSWGVEFKVEIYEMATAYFQVRDPSVDYPTWFAFQKPAETDSNLFYGFGQSPWGPRGTIRVAPDFEVDPLHSPREADGTPRAADLRRTADWVRRHMPGLDPEPLRPSTCLIALPADPGRDFYLGTVPEGTAGAGRVVVCAAGWMFKFAPLFGQICVDLAVDGATSHDISRLTFGR